MIRELDAIMLYKIIAKKNNVNEENLNKLLKHIISVKNIAKIITTKINTNRSFLNYKINEHQTTIGALFHDIGRLYCLPILDNGYPMIFHGIIGGYILRQLNQYKSENLLKYAQICEKHIGTGIKKEELLENTKNEQIQINTQLFLTKIINEKNTFNPETIEEIVVCFSDKLVSKTTIITIEEAYKQTQEINQQSAKNFKKMFLILKTRGAFPKTKVL